MVLESRPFSEQLSHLFRIRLTKGLDYPGCVKELFFNNVDNVFQIHAADK